MRPDTISIILRSASFIALFQAAGMTIFLVMFGPRLDVSRNLLRRITIMSAIAAAFLLVGQYTLEAARMADDMAGMVDPSLQALVMHSSNSAVLGFRLLGLFVIALAVGRRGSIGTAPGVIGFCLIALSFMLTGHTAAHPWRWVLAPLLTLHVAIVAFWFGALIPLHIACTRETPPIAARVTDAFSKVATALVPAIAAAGVILASVLIQNISDLRTGYGLSLIAKFSGFVVLMGIASLNKWRLGPAINSGDERALRAFRRSLCLEYVLIAAVLSVTAVMTTLYSPGGSDQ